MFAGYTRPGDSFKNHGFLLDNELTDFDIAASIDPVTASAWDIDVESGRRPPAARRQLGRQRTEQPH